MAGDEPLSDDLADAVLDGRPLDWAAAESGATEAQRARIAHLRTVAAIASFHMQPDGGESAGPPAFDRSSWGHLRSVEPIGRGAFGAVYRAWDPQLYREVALKLLPAVGEQGDLALAEGRLLARIRHPNVVTVYGAAEHDGLYGIWMEFVQGRTLEAVLRADGPFGASEAVRIGVDLCGALSAVHRAGLIHRDVKAQNVMREAGGRIVLMDFGTGREDFTDKPSEIAGTPLYLAPEVFAGTAATAASDIYSLGVVLFHLVTGSYPAEGRSVADIRDAHARRRRLWLRDARPDLPNGFVEAIERALEIDPTQRYESVEAMEAVLSRVIASADLATREATREATAAPSHAGAHRPRAKASLLIAVAVLGAGVLGMIGWRLRPRTVPIISFQPRDWVVISDFENLTGGPLLDGTLESAFERELTTSRFINVIGRARLADTLLLMRRPPSTRLDRNLAREIAVRDGGVRVLLAGRVERLSRRDVITVDIVAPRSGGLLASVKEEVASDQISESIHRLALHVRQTLGERSGEPDGGRHVRRLTTGSLTAWRLYSEADALGEDGQLGAAEHLLREAIHDDPQFASAHVLIAWALRNQKRPPSEYLPPATRAMQLAELASFGERLFIRSSVLFFKANKWDEDACAANAALLEEQPDQYWANTHAFSCQAAAGNLPEAAEYQARCADLRPNSLAENAAAAWAFDFMIRDTPRAAPYYTRAEHVLTGVYGAAGIYERRGWPDPWLRLLPAYKLWLGDDIGGALNGVNATVARDGNTQDVRARRDLYTFAGFFMITLGHLTDAERMFMTGEQTADRRAGIMALVMYARGNDVQARQLESTYTNLPGPVAATLSARFGLEHRARAVPLPDEWVQWWGENASGPAGMDIVDGELALRAGHLDHAIDRLTSTTHGSQRHPTSVYFLAMESLGKALARRGRIDRAISAIETAAAERQRAYDVDYDGPMAGYFWMRTQNLLARLYRQQGRVADARRVEDHLLRLLALADRDHAILRDILSRQSHDVSRVE